MQQIPMVVAKDLHFEMARSSNVLLQENGGIAKGRAGFALGLFQFSVEFRRIADHAHAPPATAHSGLDDDGKSDLARDAMRLLRGLDRFLVARQNGNARRCGQPSSRSFVAQQLKQIRRWADKG
jgi:hypothetical protein